MGRGKGKKAATSGAKRQKKLSDKKKEEDSQAWAEKNKNKMKKYRANMSTEKKKEVKKRQAEQKKEKRKEAKIAKQQRMEDAYQTPAALGKARSKVAKALPSDPIRAKEVVDSLKRIVDKRNGPMEFVKAESHSEGIRTEVKNKVQEFYYRQDISITFPGKKDYVTVKESNGKYTKMVKHVLVLTLREAFHQFTIDHQEIKMSLDKFSKLRPPNVLPRHKLPKNVCVCRCHANINYLITPLQKHNGEFPANQRDLLKVTTCSQGNMENEDCQTGKCKDCNSLMTMDKMVEMIGTSEQTLKAWYSRYYRWEEEQDGEGKERLRKNEKEGSLYAILQQLMEEWPEFRIHRKNF